MNENELNKETSTTQTIEINPIIEEEIEVDNNIKGEVKNLLKPEFLRAVINNKNTVVLNATVKTYNPHNVANALEDLNDEEIVFFFKTVNPDISAEIFTLIDQDHKERVVQAFSSKELQELVDEMQTDNLVDFVDELPANLVTKVLRAASPGSRSQINVYLKFKDDSAGTLMTPEYLSLRDTATVKDAIEKIRKFGKDMETVWEIFIIDSTRRLVGTITLDKLLEADEDDILRSIMKADFISVCSDIDQEEVIKAFRQYDISVLPVTNKEKRMLGIITFDDVIDIANEENTEDIQLTSAVLPTETPYLDRSLFQVVKSYAIWLLILVFLDTFISMTLSYLQQPLNVVPILIAFLSAIMATNSNAADQTGTVIIREIALGNVTTKNYWKVVRKEVCSALITGGILAIFSFGWTMMELNTKLVSLGGENNLNQQLINNYYGGNTQAFFASIAAVLSLTLIIVIIIAKWLGVSIPLLAKKLHIDPAVMSQPVISTILDIVSIVVYLLVSVVVIRGVSL